MWKPIKFTHFCSFSTYNCIHIRFKLYQSSHASQTSLFRQTLIHLGSQSSAPYPKECAFKSHLTVSKQAGILYSIYKSNDKSQITFPTVKLVRFQICIAHPVSDNYRYSFWCWSLEYWEQQAGLKVCRWLALVQCTSPYSHTWWNALASSAHKCVYGCSIVERVNGGVRLKTSAQQFKSFLTQDVFGGKKNLWVVYVGCIFHSFQFSFLLWLQYEWDAKLKFT